MNVLFFLLLLLTPPLVPAPTTRSGAGTPIIPGVTQVVPGLGEGPPIVIPSAFALACQGATVAVRQFWHHHPVATTTAGAGATVGGAVATKRQWARVKEWWARPTASPKAPQGKQEPPTIHFFDLNGAPPAKASLQGLVVMCWTWLVELLAGLRHSLTNSWDWMQSTSAGLVTKGWIWAGYLGAGLHGALTSCWAGLSTFLFFFGGRPPKAEDKTWRGLFGRALERLRGLFRHDTGPTKQDLEMVYQVKLTINTSVLCIGFVLAFLGLWAARWASRRPPNRRAAPLFWVASVVAGGVRLWIQDGFWYKIVHTIMEIKQPISWGIQREAINLYVFLRVLSHLLLGLAVLFITLGFYHAGRRGGDRPGRWVWVEGEQEGQEDAGGDEGPAGAPAAAVVGELPTLVYSPALLPILVYEPAELPYLDWSNVPPAAAEAPPPHEEPEEEPPAAAAAQQAPAGGQQQQAPAAGAGGGEQGGKQGGPPGGEAGAGGGNPPVEEPPLPWYLWWTEW